MKRPEDPDTLIVRPRLGKLTHPPKRLTSTTLFFAHCIPGKNGRGKTEQDVHNWAVKLAEGTGLKPADFRKWVIEWHGDASDDRVTAKFFAYSPDAVECLQLANGLERSFIKNGGGPSYRIPDPPAPSMGVVSVEEIQRIDKEMGELYLHCPKCGNEERINDMGKLMLKKGNNVFAKYPCKKCGTVFNGARHTRHGTGPES
jgi:hypothetical protein